MHVSPAATTLAAFALGLIIVGAVVPLSWFFVRNHYMTVVRDDTGWEEGGCFIVFLRVLGVVALFQLVGIALAAKLWALPLARAAVILAIVVLASAAAFVLWLVASLLLEALRQRR